jgi:regulatory protein
MHDAAFQDALGRALKRLQTSDRYESEVRATLRRFPADVVERVVAYLRQHRLLDDERTTHQAVEVNTGRRAVGDALLADRLVARGADENLVAQALTEAETEADRIDAILRAKYQPTDNRMKAGRFLFSRGFSEEAIESALDRYFEVPAQEDW